MPRFSLLSVVAALAFAAAAAPAALAEPNAFSAPQALPGTLPSDDQFNGGEPSVEFDPAGDGHVYAVAPGADGFGANGVGFWRSADHGVTFGDAQAIGSKGGGGDSDVEVGIDHTVYVADLELAANAICRSKDFGVHFDSGCETGAASNQTGPESDREWINRDPKRSNVLYFTYHDVAAELPLIYQSTDGGSHFVPCGLIYQPGTPAFSNFGPGGTDVGKPAISRDGAIYVPITEPDGNGSPTSPYDHFEVAVAKSGCSGGTQFSDHEIYFHEGASLANIFSDVAVGVDGTVYALAAGTLTGDQKTYDVYLWVSHDQGTTWSKPIQVNTPDLTSNELPALATGNAPGQLAIGFYGSGLSGDPSSDANQWRYYVATSTDDGATFQQTTITPDPYHWGGICTTGILCVSGNRNLLDFSSIAVDPSDGTVLPVFPGDPFDTPSNQNPSEAAAYVARQTAGTRLTLGATTLPGESHAPGGGAAVPNPAIPVKTAAPSAKPSACAATSGFAAVGAHPAGSRVRVDFSRRLQREADIDVFQASQGRRVVKERLVARFTGREFGFTWNGKANRPRRKVTDGYYFVRYRMPLGATETKGGRADTRRITLVRRHGRWSLRPSFYRKASCGTLSAYKLLRPAFGGPRNSALGISYRLSRAARVRITVTHAGRVVQRFAARSAKADHTYRLTFSARRRAHGDYRFRLVAVRGGRSVTATLTSTRL